jgi:pimeloyl-ACP methyl ester carboxylesterase
MPAPSFALALSFLAAVGQTPPAQPLRTLIRTTSRRFNPPRREVLSSVPGPAVRAALAAGVGSPAALATVRREQRRGPRPTLVLGGFVPDAAEQVYLLRGYLARQGSVYYLDYPKGDFSSALLAAQLDDLAADIAAREGAPPVVVAVSFGAGVALDWLRRARLAGRTPPVLAGLVLVSPVCCAEDILPAGEAKPGTLLGRALKPLLAPRDAPDEADEAAVDKARQIFARMFEAGVQNKAALATLLTRAELAELRAAVAATISGLSSRGATARVRAMKEMASPSSYLTPELLPLCPAPALVLYAEKEGAVLSERSPARAALERSCAAFFPAGACRVVTNPRGAPVQHASLIFHVENFLPHFGRFYRSLKPRKTLRIR